ncbi:MULTISPECIES: metallophosphoesterase family protein [Xanthomonas]|uniref:metallophosphoesterase family protein n=1 Tax=Xanthomonas sp. Leaf148 TaxID=1736275 RepID=UPI0009EB91EB|nr:MULTISPECIES: metallophosphoesterase family protein [Xanthomonas]
MGAPLRCDRSAWALAPLVLFSERVQVSYHRHLKTLAPGVAADIVISGHSHKPSIQTRDGVLYINPGSAGPRRFRLPISVATLWLGNGPPRAALQVFEPH